jgi:hypothetical protein
MIYNGESSTSAKDISALQHQRAAERGHVCMYPSSFELFLDIDSFEGLGRLHATLNQNAYIKSIVDGVPLVKTSPSGKAGRFHVIVFLKKRVDKFERITLQALLGSDLSREILSYQEAQAGCEQPTVFFEKAPPPPVSGSVPSPDDALPPFARSIVEAREQRNDRGPSGYDMGGRY